MPQGSPAPLANLRGLAAICVTTTEHAAEKPEIPLDNLRTNALAQQNFNAHFSTKDP
jgi:hypothetical protein